MLYNYLRMRNGLRRDEGQDLVLRLEQIPAGRYGKTARAEH